MSLLDSFYKKYTIMNETIVDDPEGGWVTGWARGGYRRNVPGRPHPDTENDCAVQ